MVDWLVITADCPGIGRGVRGFALIWFLRTYFGRRSVRVCTPSQVRKSRSLAAKHCLIGLPTTLDASDVEALRSRIGDARVALFDYRDQHELAWTAQQEPALRRLTDVYLKPWFEPAWQYDLQMGLLPIRRYGRFSAAVRMDRALAQLSVREPRIYDVAFVGRPNQTRLVRDGKIELVEQRAQWIHDLKRDAPDLSFWGGLVGVDGLRRQALQAKFGDVAPLMHSVDKVSFPAYFRSLKRSRVLLAPGGNVPWTYRHYECLYSGAVVVSIDYRQRDMLAPLPRELMVHAPDDQSVVPAVREALRRFQDEPKLGEATFSHLEQYLRFGAYARNRQMLINRFVGQLD